MDNNDEVHSLCLEVFAGISAIVTHDLKNTLAIINENAGLLDDLAGMVEKDDGVPTDRVRTAVAKISQQVARSNTIIKNLNRFAHSGDSPVAQAAVGDLLHLMVSLTGRKAAMRSISVKVEEPGTHPQIETSLFVLEALLYRVLTYLYGTIPAGTGIVLTTEQEATGLVIRFGADLAALADGAMEGFPGPSELVLLEFLGGSLTVEETAVVLQLKRLGKC